MSAQEWKEKLVGKTYVEGEESTSDANSFTKNDLPDFHRIVKRGTMLTMDFNTERLNVHVDNEGKCTNCTMG